MPVVGSLKNGRYSFEGRSYPLSNHGFAQESEFAVEHETPESAERFFIKDGLIDPERTVPAFDTSRTIELTRTLFDQGALVFKHLHSRSFSLRNSLNARSVTIVTEGAPFFALWAEPGAPFVCIEPRHGISDGMDTSGDLTRKEGILYLDPEGSFETGYRIDIG